MTNTVKILKKTEGQQIAPTTDENFDFNLWATAVKEQMTCCLRKKDKKIN